MANTEIRQELKNKNIPYWKIADKLGVHENTVIRRLRHELPEQEKEQIFSIISELSNEKQEETA